MSFGRSDAASVAILGGSAYAGYRVAGRRWQGAVAGAVVGYFAALFVELAGVVQNERQPLPPQLLSWAAVPGSTVQTQSNLSTDGRRFLIEKKPAGFETQLVDDRDPKVAVVVKKLGVSPFLAGAKALAIQHYSLYGWTAGV